ncbi:hypothetical protein [Luteimonas terrae]|uniref:DUF4760 domain-containing protein n=1 Tax=Luteimonas terrae TaxID=1530191 RepID=A0ABU1Y2L3_9GAMM|nr:hypothetical protein [Luteimonas terrae]MDR7194576.1 hypothetical protein [Luteimonas terrae]
MTDPFIVALIAGLSAVLGAGVTSFFSNRSQSKTNQTLLLIEKSKLENTKITRDEEVKRDALKIVFIAIISASREFSTSKAVSILDAKMDLLKFDEWYFSQSKSMDEARFFAHIYAQDIQGDLESINSKMNIYWGNLRGALINKSCDLPHSQSEGLIGSAVSASMDIETLARGAKNLIVEHA